MLIHRDSVAWELRGGHECGEAEDTTWEEGSMELREGWADAVSQRLAQPREAAMTCCESHEILRVPGIHSLSLK